HVVVGVSANQALIDRAIELRADAVIVHHGFFWKGEPQALRGWKGRRIGALMRHDISLFGYHLPLDAHAELGNNVQVLKALGALPSAQFGGGSPPLGWLGQLAEATPRSEMIARLEAAVGPVGTAFLHGPELISRVGVVTGGGAGFFEAALAEDVDLFVTGEPSEQSQGYAVELGGNFVAAGHHATERFGPRALGDYLSNTFSLAVTFVDIANPV
ncbi:MAG: dinuclear metal center YbgI/SA1388 family protein, partial [Bradymonadia bacterium]